jgi:hypothetical protein
MIDLIEFVEDLDTIATFGSDSDTMDGIMEKWGQRLKDAQEEADRQYELFSGVARLLDKRYETFEMDDGA